MTDHNGSVAIVTNKDIVLEENNETIIKIDCNLPSLAADFILQPSKDMCDIYDVVSPDTMTNGNQKAIVIRIINDTGNQIPKLTQIPQYMQLLLKRIINQGFLTKLIRNL